MCEECGDEEALVVTDAGTRLCLPCLEGSGYAGDVELVDTP